MTTVRNILSEAHRRNRELSPYILMGIRESRRIGFAAMSRTLGAYKRQGNVFGALERAIHPLIVLLRDMMVVAHLVGMLQVFRASPNPVALSASPFGLGVRMLRKRARMDRPTLDDLQQRYGAEAVRMVAKATDATEHKLQEAMWHMQAKGMHVREGVVELQRAFEASGVTATKSHVLEAIFRTQTQIANSAGQYQAARDPAVNEILWGWRYVAVGDERSRPEHAALDGTTLPKDDPRWEEIFPPNGYNCRCSVIEIFDKVPRGGIKEPPNETVVDGVMIPVAPDKGFAWNPGTVYRDTTSKPKMSAGVEK